MKSPELAKQIFNIRFKIPFNDLTNLQAPSGLGGIREALTIRRILLRMAGVWDFSKLQAVLARF